MDMCDALFVHVYTYFKVNYFIYYILRHTEDSPSVQPPASRNERTYVCCDMRDTLGVLRRVEASHPLRNHVDRPGCSQWAK